MQTTSKETARGSSELLSGDVWTLVVVHAPKAELLGVRLAVDDRGAVELGREQQLGPHRLDDSRMSRRHATIALEGGVPVVRDRGSSNGTTVNGQRIESVRLESGDCVGVGSFVFLARRAPLYYRPDPLGELVGASPEHAALREELEDAASGESPLLICGEPGTGKDLMVRELHRLSGRAGPLVPVACGALDDETAAAQLFGSERGPGLLREAAGGTVLLDSVGDAPPQAQAALLRFLDSGEVPARQGAAPETIDARVVATSIRPLDALVSDDALRSDFAAKLGAWCIDVPPLRRRREDIPLIARALLTARGSASLQLSRKLTLSLVRHDWPGNAHELASMLDQIVARGEGGKRELPETLARTGSAPKPRDAVVVAPDCAFFVTPEGERVELEHRVNLRNVLKALLEVRRSEPNTALTVPDLFRRGWPGEKTVGKSGPNRVYVALTTLRKLGLREVIERRRDGYLIPPGAPIELSLDAGAG